MTQKPPVPVQGDDGDWTFVITEGCPKCAFRPFDPAETARRVTDGTERWLRVLERSDVAE